MEKSIFSLSMLVATSLFSAGAKPPQQRPSFTDLPTVMITPAVGPLVNHGIDLTASVDFMRTSGNTTSLVLVDENSLSS